MKRGGATLSGLLPNSILNTGAVSASSRYMWEDVSDDVSGCRCHGTICCSFQLRKGLVRFSSPIVVSSP